MRYIGPVYRKSRRLGFSILENNKEFSKGKKRKTVPGQHGGKFKKLTQFGIQLKERQKVKFLYGINETQLRNLYLNGQKHRGQTGYLMLNNLESRLDNLVYRLNFAPTRKAARQLVNHGNILVDNKKVNICSQIIKPGQVISVKEKARSFESVKKALESNVATCPYVELDKANFSGKYLRNPKRNEFANDINELVIVEYYNQNS
ncbi:30S ribosomal protein S4 [symbiont of Argiope bruennichi]|uniref:30S ribosomal protein S4 n=1 Tax=symbiont of Argiope bruennichi TaxID=2810479 RepID=UPI003DA218ED